jgi:hypothetical protein
MPLLYRCVDGELVRALRLAPERLVDGRERLDAALFAYAARD